MQKTRYSEEELTEFKTIIEKKLNDTNIEYQELVNRLKNLNENGTDDTKANLKIMEDGSDVSIKEEINYNAQRLQRFIENLEHALIRINNKSYGICRMTGQLIPKQRLLAVPHATLSMEAKMGQVKKSN